jgi:hypothetical protein
LVKSDVREGGIVMNGIMPVIVLVGFMATVAGLLVPFGSPKRSIADRVSPRSAANSKNNKLG